MAVDKLVDSSQLDAGLESVADAIRAKGGTSGALAFPVGFVSAIQAIPTGGGSSKNFQVDNTNHRISGTTYVDTGAEITVAAAGKYNIYWSAFRSSTSSGTNGTQCYVNDNTQGSAFTTWSYSYAQSPKLSGVTLAKNDVIKIYARASSSSRYVCVANLTIEQTD